MGNAFSVKYEWKEITNWSMLKYYAYAAWQTMLKSSASWVHDNGIARSQTHFPTCPKVPNTSTITCEITSSDMDLKIEWTGSPQQRNKEQYWDRMDRERERETCQRLKCTLQPLWITFRKDIKGIKLFPEEQEIWVLQQADQLLHPAQKRQVPKMLNFKNQ